MNKLIYIAILSFILYSCMGQTKKEKNKLVDSKKDEWISLFDGKTTEGWHYYNGGELGREWEVKDGILTFDPKNRDEIDKKYNIVTNEKFTNFILSIEWNIAECGNSGLFWGVHEDKRFVSPYLTGPEIQILDNERHSDAFMKPKYHQAGALYDIVQPSKDVCNPAGEWNHFLLTVNHETNNANVKLNGTEIVSFPINGPEWEDLISTCKFRDKSTYNYIEAPEFGKYKTGKIGLQDHGDRVSFRNIKIKRL